MFAGQRPRIDCRDNFNIGDALSPRLQLKRASQMGTSFGYFAHRGYKSHRVGLNTRSLTASCEVSLTKATKKTARATGKLTP